MALNDGSRIAIIGGGPAGSFFSHFIHKNNIERGIELSITIFDGKDFLQKGPRGCNLCAGVIAESLNQKLRSEGIFLPEKRIINRVEGYCLHINGETLPLSYTESRGDAIATVFRGNGPRYSTFPEVISFDDFLLSYAQDLGTKVIPWPVWGLDLPEDRTRPVTLYYGLKDRPETYEADLVVGAFGVNTYLMAKIQELGFGYRPPSTLIAYQAELMLGAEMIRRHFDNMIHVYMPKASRIRYATVIPKGDFITVTLIGKRDADRGIYFDFLKLEEIQGKISALKPQCFCYPRIVVSPAKKPFTDRFMIIGDASFSRHYKNGIESAFLTAKLAAEASVCLGIDAASISTYYLGAARKRIIHDNRYGRLLFFLNDIISSTPLLTQAHLMLAKNPNKKKASRTLKDILWHMFTGNISYKDIFALVLNLKLQASLLWNTMSLVFARVQRLIDGSQKGKTDVGLARPSEE